MHNQAQLIGLIDLTSLNDNDTELVIETLCQKATTALGNVAAVCIYPQFIKRAKACLQNTAIPVATVTNFPLGNTKLSDVLIEIEAAIIDGADEIDLVIPYHDYLENNKQSTIMLVKAAKAVCGKKYLKVILETGALVDKQIIYDISCRVLEADADFIKTSTGKIETGATITAAEQMLRAIQSVNPQAGLKVSGGVKTPAQAQAYLDLAQEKMGSAWCTAQHFRIGASSLLDALLKEEGRS